MRAEVVVFVLNLFDIIFLQTAPHNTRHFAIHCFVTAVLWRILHLSYRSEPV